MSGVSGFMRALTPVGWMLTSVVLALSPDIVVSSMRRQTQAVHVATGMMLVVVSLAMLWGLS